MYCSPVCHFTTVLLRLLVRLACVRRAASVRSEPGSNSRKLSTFETQLKGRHFNTPYSVVKEQRFPDKRAMLQKQNLPVKCPTSPDGHPQEDSGSENCRSSYSIDWKGASSCSAHIQHSFLDPSNQYRYRETWTLRSKGDHGRPQALPCWISGIPPSPLPRSGPAKCRPRCCWDCRWCFAATDTGNRLLFVISARIGACRSHSDTSTATIWSVVTMDGSST